MQVKPTRSELLKLKKKINLAKDGHELLRKKRDNLILEFFEMLKRTRTVKQELAEKYKEALYKMNAARILESDVTILSIARAIRDKPEINVKTRNIMGVMVPQIDSSLDEKTESERGFGILTASISLLEATEAYEDLLEHILIVAEVETGLKKILKAIESTKRRVNALEFEAIPKMEDMHKRITSALEEQERENIYRAKRVKSKSSWR